MMKKKMLGKKNFQKVAKFVIRQQVSRIGNQFLSHVEIGAQEAAYLILQKHLRQSIIDVFIDKNLADQRTVLLKSFIV